MLCDLCDYPDGTARVAITEVAVEHLGKRAMVRICPSCLGVNLEDGAFIEREPIAALLLFVSREGRKIGG